MAFNSPANCKMSDLGMCVAGTGSSTGTSTATKRLRADLSGGSGSNIKLWDSFKPGSRDITFNPTGTSNAFTFSSNTGITATMNYSSSGTYWASRVIGNSSWLYSKWEANQTSGDDTVTYGSRTATTFAWTHNLGAGGASPDFWVIKQVIPSSSAFERFFCNTTSGNEINDETITVYDTSGGGGGV